jgi:TusA-related sulfurtransferase
MHRIARRAISYGLDTSASNYRGTTPPAPQTGSGLLFLCFQANYKNQFNLLQQQWANQSDFILRGVGQDPVIGQGGQTPGGQSWPTTWGIPEKKQLDFRLFVHMKGGEYFFAPSIGFLQSLNPVQEKVLTVKHSAQVLDVAGASQADGANVQQWISHDGDNQIWILEDAGDGYYFLVSKHSGKVLDVAGASQEAGANVLQWFKHDGDNQQWKLEGAGDGYSFVVSKHSGQVLDCGGRQPGTGGQCAAVAQAWRR